MLVLLLFCSRLKLVRYFLQLLKIFVFNLNINFFFLDLLVKSLVLQFFLNEEKLDLLFSFSRLDDQYLVLFDILLFILVLLFRLEFFIICENISNIYVWKVEEEDVLVNFRYEKNEKFLKFKNYFMLWKDIIV